jgi:glycosyltransferase involved in cell wall biosynthesis
VARSLPGIITVSKAARRDISRDFTIKESRFHVVPNGIDTGRFYPIPAIDREPGRLIVTNSADIPLKGLRYLLEAVARVSGRHRVRLTVIGAPKKNSPIPRLIRELGIGALVTFTGRISHEEFVHQYARAAIAVVPSVYEGFGLPAGEAMACAVPVISTSGGALPEVVGDAGVLIPPASADALTAAILQLLEDPDRARQLGVAGYHRVMNEFTWSRAAQKTINAYRKVIGGYG